VSVSWNRDDSGPDTPVVDGKFWRGVLIALPVSAACWAFILGMGYLGYRLSFVI
jgi:hypothetical protein